MNSNSTDAERVETAVGSAVERREDPALITGEARYTDDFTEPGMAHAAILRSQYGHARIEGIDTDAAEAHDGVIAVLTAEDVAEGTPGTIPVGISPPSGPPFDLKRGLSVPDRPMLGTDVVRYTGEPIAIVVAEDRYTAHDALDLLSVDYQRLDAVVDRTEASAEDAPQLHEGVPDNVGFEWTVGDQETTAEAFENASHTTSLDLRNQRLAPNAMEPRVALASYEPGGKLTVRMATQTPHDHQALLAEVLGLPESEVRVIKPEVGGGFGSKSKFYPSELLAAWASVKLERPVKWQATRTEGIGTDAHGRGHDTRCELALDEDGTVLGLRAETRADLGAYFSKVAPYIATGGYATMLSGQYAIPAIHCRVTGVFTNTTPVDAYRGAGRPEAVFVVERLMDRAAAELGFDPVELRRRNFVPPAAFPYETAAGSSYDSGEYEATLDRALELVDYDELRERQAELREDGRYLGIGVSSLVEKSGTPYDGSGQIRFEPSGEVTVFAGTADHGQGHGTTFAQVVADELGVAYDDIEFVEGDTELISEGAGSFGSRSAIMGGNAVAESARNAIGKARSIAARRFEAAEKDVVFDDGDFSVAGAPDRSVPIQEIARSTYADADGEGDLPAGVEPGLESTARYDSVVTYPFGAHIAVVEVDPESGEIEFERYAAVDDCGNQLNPLIVEGQIHGGIAQGIGQALYEEVVYDDNGTLLTGSMQDYVVPAAGQVPEIRTDTTTTPSPRNELGVKGIGETGTIAAPAAVVNAVVDALKPFGVTHIDMPLTPEKVWREIENARGE